MTSANTDKLATEVAGAHGFKEGDMVQFRQHVLADKFGEQAFALTGFMFDDAAHDSAKLRNADHIWVSVIGPRTEGRGYFSLGAYIATIKHARVKADAKPSKVKADAKPGKPSKQAALAKKTLETIAAAKPIAVSRKAKPGKAKPGKVTGKPVGKSKRAR